MADEILHFFCSKVGFSLHLVYAYLMAVFAARDSFYFFLQLLETLEFICFRVDLQMKSI